MPQVGTAIAGNGSPLALHDTVLSRAARRNSGDSSFVRVVPFLLSRRDKRGLIIRVIPRIMHAEARAPIVMFLDTRAGIRMAV